MAKKQDPRRRDFLKKAAYSAPAVLTLQAVSGVAKAGSEKPRLAEDRSRSKPEDEEESASTAYYRSIDDRDAVRRMSERGVCY